MTERLTEKTDEGIWVKESHGDNVMKTLYQCHGAEPLPNYSNCDEGYCGMEKLAEYETAEEEGRLKVLPCKVGDIIFCIVRPGIIRQFKVLSIEIYEYGAILELLYAGNVEKYRFWRMYMPSDDFGKKLFLTSEETEKALKEMEEKMHE